MHAATDRSQGSFPGYLFYCLVLLCPLAYLRFGYHTLFAIEFRRMALFAPLALAGGLYLAFRKNYWRRRSSLHRPLLLFCGGLVLATVFSQSRPLSIETTAHFLLGAMLFYLAAFYLRPEQDLPRLRGAIALATVLAAGYSLLQHAGGNPLQLLAEGERHQSATFVTRNLLAAYLLFGLIFLVDGLLRETRAFPRALHAAGALAATAALALTLTVSAWIAFAVALAAYLGLARRLDSVRLRWGAALLVTAALVVGALEWRKPAGLRRTWRDKLSRLATGESQSVRERVVMWKIAGRIALEHMVAGSGPGTYAVVRDQHAGRYLEQARYRDLRGLSVWAHNDLLQIAAEAGAAGLLPLLALLAAGAWLPVTLLRKDAASRAHLARVLPFWAGWLGLSVHMLFHFTLYAPASAFYWWLSLGVVAGHDLRGVRRPASFGKLRRGLLRAALLLVGLGLPLLQAGQFIARHQQARGYDKRLAAEKLIEQREPEAGGRQRLRLARALLDDSRRDYALSARLRPWSGSMWAQLGALERSEGRPDLALAAYHRALRWNPFDANVHYEIGLVQHERDQLGPAEQYAARAVALRPNLPAAHCLRGRIELRRKRRDRALAHFARARAADPTDPGGYHWGAICLLQMGRLVESQQLLEQGLAAIRRSEGNTLMTAHLFAINALAHNKPQEALRLWESASRHLGGTPWLDTFQELARGLVDHRRKQMGSETIHELDRQTGELLAALGPLPKPERDPLFRLRRAFHEKLLAALRARLADQPADAPALAATGALREIDHRLARLLQQLAAAPRSPSPLAWQTAARYARELLPEIRGALERGPLFAREQVPRAELLVVLHRLSAMGRAQRTLLALHGPLFAAELALYRKLLAAGVDLVAPAERVIDDIDLLAARALARSGQHAEAAYRQIIERHGELTLTLLPPWAAGPYEDASKPARAWFEAHRPRTADVARLDLARLALARGATADAVRLAEELAALVLSEERLSTTVPSPDIETQPLVRQTLLRQPDRLALELVTLARLQAGQIEEARRCQPRIAGLYPDRRTAILARLDRLATPAGRRELIAELQRLLDD